MRRFGTSGVLQLLRNATSRELRYDEDGLRAAIMREWMWIIVGVLVWVVLTQWVLPKLGIPT